MVKLDVHQVGSILVTTVILLMGISISVWIPYGGRNNDYLNDLKQNISCASCVNCLKNDGYVCEACEKNRKLCRNRGWPYRSLSQTPQKCSENNEFIAKVKKVVNEKYHEHIVNFKTGLKKQDRNKLENAEYSISDPPRVIFHWFPLDYNRAETTGWTNLTDYERHYSTYTISTGPSGSCEKNMFFLVPETGLYNIYAKLTYACVRADQQHKRVQMEIAMVDDESSGSGSTLLKEEDENTCWLKGDLVTLYQSGLFRLDKGNKIYIKYKTPHGVKLSSERRSSFSSFFGAYRVGEA